MLSFKTDKKNTNMFILYKAFYQYFFEAKKSPGK